MFQLWKPRGQLLETSGWDEQVPEKIKELAAARGFSNWEDFQSWTQPRLANLRDPNRLLGMDIAIDRIVIAFEKNEIVALYGDFDLDGTSAIALLYTAFTRLGFKNLVLYQPTRLTEGYGFHVHAVEALKQKGVTLIITADVGVTAISAAVKCRELGIDLIITDHHLPAAEKPDAYALINPNQGTCTSELGDLSGVGVAFYLCWALRRKLIQLNKITDAALDLKELLDCFVIGTLTDMVPLRDENRILVKHGLLQLAKTKRPGLRFLLDELDLLGRELSSQDVAIRFAPKLNALSRMEKNIRPLDLFMVESEDEARNLMGQVIEQNELRVSLQAEAEQLAMAMSKDWIDKPFIFIYDSSFHKGIIGLVATRLSQAFKKPAFVGSLAEGGVIVGSSRAPQNWGGNLVEVLGQASNFLHRFGGHSNAAGFEYSLEQVPKIIEAFDLFFATQDSAPKKHQVIYDIELNLIDVTPNFMNWIEKMGPFGQTFEVPIFKITEVEIISTKELRGGHRRVELKCEGFTMEALLFGPSEHHLMTLGNHRIVDVLAEIQWNYFQNRKRMQLLIKDMRPFFMVEGNIHESKATEN